MSIKNTLSATKAREEIFTLISKVQTPGQYFTLTENGSPKAVIMSADEFESWQETLEVMRDFPDLHKTMAKIDRDIESGAYLKYPTLDDIFAKEGYVLNKQGNLKYGVPSSRRTRRTKKS